MDSKTVYSWSTEYLWILNTHEAKYKYTLKVLNSHEKIIRTAWSFVIIHNNFVILTEYALLAMEFFLLQHGCSQLIISNYQEITYHVHQPYTCTYRLTYISKVISSSIITIAVIPRQTCQRKFSSSAKIRVTARERESTI